MLSRVCRSSEETMENREKMRKEKKHIFIVVGDMSVSFSVTVFLTSDRRERGFDIGGREKKKLCFSALNQSSYLVVVTIKYSNFGLTLVYFKIIFF